MEANVEIADGFHEISGIGEYQTKTWTWDDTINHVVFIIDGIYYDCGEDPNDGYRSYGFIDAVPTEHIEELANKFDLTMVTFPPQKVKSRYEESGDNYGKTWKYVFVNEDDELVLEVGTHNYDDYYPCAVFNWSPENLPINKIVKESENV